MADDKMSRLENVPCDSTTSWMPNKKYADDAVDKHNANDLKDIKKCRKCGEYFWQTDNEREWFVVRNMKAPCRCYTCRKRGNNYG